MSMYLTRENTPGQGRGWAFGPQLPYGFMSPMAVVLGLGALRQMPQPDRLVLADPPVQQGNAQPNLQDPRALDAGRILDYGAPAPLRVVEPAAFPWRPTEAPRHAQRVYALGGREVWIG